MFSRGSWAIVGLVKESLEGFKLSLADQPRMAAASQLAASSMARLYGADALGLNPYSDPRLDESQPLTPEQQTELARHSIAEQEDVANQPMPAEILDGPGYGHSAERFQLHSTLPWFGLWAVSNEWKKAADLPSIKEQRSYVNLERPYKFLQATDKKSVDQETTNATTLVRKQVPVLLDFNEGRAYIESTDKKLIYNVIVRLSQLGAEIIPVGWSYPTPNWTEHVLNRLHQDTQYGDEFNKRAEEAKRFTDKEIEKHEDRELETIVSKYFSMTETPGGFWVGISGPAKIRIHTASQPLSVKPPTTATNLLNLTDEAAIVTGALTFQECIMVETKDGGQRRIRRDIARLELNDKINLSEVGAAMLRGFDLVSHRKDVQHEIKKTRQIPTIPQFWGAWLQQLSGAVYIIEATLRELLDLDGNQPAGIIPLQIAEKTEPAAEA